MCKKMIDKEEKFTWHKYNRTDDDDDVCMHACKVQVLIKIQV